MVRRQRSVNDYSSTLSSGITDSATSMSVASATGLPTEGDFFLNVGAEIVLATHISGTTLTIIRAQEGTSAVAHSGGAAVTDVITAGEFENRCNERMGIKALPYGRCTSWDGSALTTITASDFTIINSSTGAAVFDGNDGVIGFSTRVHSGNDATGVIRNFGSANDWRIIAHIGAVGFNENGNDALHFNTRQGTGGAMFGLEMIPKNGIWYTTRTTYLANPVYVLEDECGGLHDYWAKLEIEWDTSGSTDTFRFAYSKDGVNWWDLYTHTQASSTIQVGAWLTNRTGDAFVRGSIFSWHEEALTF